MDESKNNGLEAEWIENRKQQEHATQREVWNCWSAHWDGVILTLSSLSLNQSRDKTYAKQA